ncbi:glycoprotein-N-acetylgalactosamine 3-beta-galactosyltransferase 1-like [Gigantopelta aegis]|uniref:glycoprotein-N-acetylgalactosamine 3-beta-galactosyltransferase 1-like n=1 Tax=Gigantopelta aegis TaxID=1735272 RepID=UPI001B88E58D|nr:glycoprotein-N-acetylgalactosamine 3-beta-galactosyltransferase 1-like [Gigantopelta aegis]
MSYIRPLTKCKFTVSLCVYISDDDRVGEELRRKVRILCWVMTSPRNLGNKAAAVKDTWGKRCDVLLFFSSVSNSTFPVIGLNVSEGRDHLTAKTMQAFYYIYQHHLNDADWFMKTDDDTYVIIENLRYLLSTQNASRPVYFGHHFKYINDRRTYNSGGAGYVISKEALTRYGVQGRANKSICRQDGEAEDLSFGECMENLGVVIGNSADSSGRTRFHCFMLNAHLVGDFPDWYYNFSVKAVAKGIDSVSDYAISFHYCRPQDMYMFEFLVYHLQLYGVISGRQDIT